NNSRILTPETRIGLVQAMSAANVRIDAKFLVEGIRVFVRIGDCAPLLLAERLSNLSDSTSASERVKEAALKALPALRVLANKEKQASSLLRAAKPGGHSTHLRPLAAPTSAESEELL